MQKEGETQVIVKNEEVGANNIHELKSIVAALVKEGRVAQPVKRFMSPPRLPQKCRRDSNIFWRVVMSYYSMFRTDSDVEVRLVQLSKKDKGEKSFLGLGLFARRDFWWMKKWPLQREVTPSWMQTKVRPANNFTPCRSKKKFRS